MRSMALLFGVAGLLSACEPNTGPEVQIQFCLTADHNAEALKATLQQFAREQGLDYLDRSAETEEELKRNPDVPAVVRRSFPIINVSARRDDGLGFGGGNAGLPANQVSVGIGSMADREEAKQLAQKLITVLEQKWELRRVPEGQGAFPIECP